MSSLGLLEESERPTITILCSSFEQFEILKNKVHYPHLDWMAYAKRPNIIARILNKIFRPFLKKNIFEVRLKGDLFDLVYPVNNQNQYHLRLLNNKVDWIPDFQDDHLPEFFSKEKILSRKSYQKELARTSNCIVLSSKDACSDFKRLYPESGAEIKVIPFAVTHPKLEADISELLAKYSLSAEYYICSNQFWQHKNHMVVLKALLRIKESGKHALVVFTGKPHDPKAPKHYDELLEFVSDNKLDEFVKFLGFIPREDQLLLLKHSKALIQPSWFEGWGTTVEDAKSMSKFVIASDIPVHREQITQNGWFFKPDSALELSQLMTSQIPEPSKVNYDQKRLEFAANFMQLFSKV